MENRIQSRFSFGGNILSLYITAGFPRLSDTVTLIELAQQAGVDMIEIGVPFSDPVADGVTIQTSCLQAIRNGMTLEYLLRELEDIRKVISIPLVLMGYLNPIVQYGVRRFVEQIARIGIDGFIIPDLPVEEYQTGFRPMCEHLGILPNFLITPRTTCDRLIAIDRLNGGFLYLVSSEGVTGGAPVWGPLIEFRRLPGYRNLQTPILLGFGIGDRHAYQKALTIGQGAIIGSAFLRAIAAVPPALDNSAGSDRILLSDMVHGFVSSLRPPSEAALERRKQAV